MNSSRFSRVADILKNFLKFGCLTFGGGWSIIAQIQKEYVAKKQWITDEQLLNFTSVGRSIPGLMVANVSVLFGYQTAGFGGAAAALTGITLPPFLIMIGVVYMYRMLMGNPWMMSAMAGVRAAVVPIILSAMLKLVKSGLKDLPCWVIAFVSLFLCLFTKLSNVLIVLAGAIAGILIMEGKHRYDLR